MRWVRVSLSSVGSSECTVVIEPSELLSAVGFGFLQVFLPLSVTLWRLQQTGCRAVKQKPLAFVLDHWLIALTLIQMWQTLLSCVKQKETEWRQRHAECLLPSRLRYFFTLLFSYNNTCWTASTFPGQISPQPWSWNIAVILLYPHLKTLTAQTLTGSQTPISERLKVRASASILFWRFWTMFCPKKCYKWILLMI